MTAAWYLRSGKAILIALNIFRRESLNLRTRIIQMGNMVKQVLTILTSGSFGKQIHFLFQRMPRDKVQTARIAAVVPDLWKYWIIKRFNGPTIRGITCI